MNATQKLQARQVHEYVNAPTGSATVENKVQQLVRQAVQFADDYLSNKRDEHGRFVNRYTGKPLDTEEGQLTGLIDAVRIMTGGDITADHIISAALDASQH